MIQYARKLPTLKFICLTVISCILSIEYFAYQKLMILPRLSAGAISLIYVGPAGRAIPWPMPTIARPAMKPPMLRGVKVEMNVEMITITQPVIIAHRRPKRSEIGADMKTPT